MPTWLAIAIGGALGAVARWLVSDGLQRWLGRGFPWGTLAVNVAGSFVLGLAVVLLIDRLALGPVWRAGILIGFVGAFTTFSTFAVETIELAGDGLTLRAGANVAASVLFCLVAAWAGMMLARNIAV